MPRSSAQISASFASVAVRGASRVPSPPVHAGAGRASAVDLAVRRQRPGRDGDERRRHHVLGQVLPRVVPQQTAELRAVRRLAGRDEPGDEPPVARALLADQDPALPHPGVAVEDRLDLPQLDPEAADLDLVVDPSEVLEARRRAGAYRSPER